QAQRQFPVIVEIGPLDANQVVELVPTDLAGGHVVDQLRQVRRQRHRRRRRVGDQRRSGGAPYGGRIGPGDDEVGQQQPPFERRQSLGQVERGLRQIAACGGLREDQFVCVD